MNEEESITIHKDPGIDETGAATRAADRPAHTAGNGVPPESAAPAEPTDVPETKRPISPRKLEANRKNATRSTGPRTPAGKAKACMNAARYGLTARYFTNLLKEGTPEWESYQNHRQSLFEFYKPVGPTEELLIEKIAVETLRYTRFLEREQNEAILETRTYWSVIKDSNRYQSSLSRQLFEAIRELEARQEKRNIEEGKEMHGESDPGSVAQPEHFTN